MSEAFEKERERLLEKYDKLIDSIEIYLEEIPLSTFGSLYNAVKHRNELEFLVLYGDVLINFDLYRFTKSFSSYENSDNHVLTRFSNHPEDSDKIVISDDGFITNIFCFIESCICCLFTVLLSYFEFKFKKQNTKP